MPKQTFFNLSDEKRGHIMKAAIDAFAQYGYLEASITYIVSQAGIAKGSFYQYFEDKDDLYLHILQLIAKRKIEVYEREFAGSTHLTLTEFMRKAAHIQLREFCEEPQLRKIGLDFARNPHEPVASRFYESMQSVADAMYTNYIEEEKRRGQLDPEADTELLNCMLKSIGQYITSWLETRGDSEIDSAAVDEVIDKLEYILTNGIYSGTNQG